MSPPEPDWERPRVRNDDSLVLQFDFGRMRAILPADIGSAAERTLSAVVGRDQAALTILKVPHHGSAGSSSADFLQAVGPTLAVVSAGRGNPFGHPAPAALERYRAMKIPVLRTDELGAIAVATDGFTADAYAWAGEDWRLVWSASSK